MLKLVKLPDFSMIFEQTLFKSVNKKKQSVYQKRNILCWIEYFFL